MPRVVLDPNVLVSGLITPRGTSAQILVALRQGSFELLVSPALLDELREVLGRDKFRRYASVDEVGAFVASIAAAGTLIDDPEVPTVGLSEDPGDEYLIALARSARADALVSGDPHLTSLRVLIPVKTPREFLASLDR